MSNKRSVEKDNDESVTLKLRKAPLITGLKKLLVLDFDGTITISNVDENTDWAFTDQKNNEARDETVRKVINFRNEEELKRLINTAMKILMEKEISDKITIITCSDPLIKTNNKKSLLLEKAKALYEIQESNKIVLVDDDIKNLKDVLNLGYLGIYAEKGKDDYLQKIGGFLGGEELERDSLKQKVKEIPSTTQTTSNPTFVLGRPPKKRSKSVNDNTTERATNFPRNRVLSESTVNHLGAASGQNKF